MNSRLQIGLEAIKLSGTFLKNQFLKRHNVSIKKDLSVLIGEDIESEKKIITTIKNLLPTTLFLAKKPTVHLIQKMFG